ncbi:MAG: ABC transporter substrate-binding protein [Pseudomonadota bacterium]
MPMLSLPSVLSAAILALFLASGTARGQTADPIVIGLDADFTGATASGGEAIRIGASAAIEEINAAGGIRGRPLRLVVTNHRANPRRGVHNFRELVSRHGAVAVLTGVQSPVAIAQLEPAHTLGIPIISPWAAATTFIDNGHAPNYAFRVSIRDAHAGGYLVGEAMRRGYRRFGFLMQNTPWGISNQRALSDAVEATGLAEIGAQVWFAWGQDHLRDEVDELLRAEVEAIFLIASPKGGQGLVAALSALPISERPVVFSHWGVVGSDFFDVTQGQAAEIQMKILQTYSFFAPTDPDRLKRLFEVICKPYRICGASDVKAPTGLARAKRCVAS